MAGQSGGLAEMLYDEDQRVPGFRKMISTHAQFSEQVSLVNPVEEEKGDANLFLYAIDGFDIASRNASTSAHSSG